MDFIELRKGSSDLASYLEANNGYSSPESSEHKPCDVILNERDYECVPMDWISSDDGENATKNVNCTEQELTVSPDFEWSHLENEVTPMEIVSPEDICVVIDTNIIMSTLWLIECLVKGEFSINGSRPLLIIPWEVLKELDGLKNRSDANKLQCRSAIRFLHSCFNAKCSNVIAQTPILAALSKLLIKIEVSDDHMIACCLQMMPLDKLTILLTNDINLCNKANTYGIDAHTKNDFTKILIPKEIHPDRIDDKYTTIIQSVEGNNMVLNPDLLKYVKLSSNDCTDASSDIFKKFKIVSGNFMLSVLKDGMSRTFQGDWTKRVFLKPPWSVSQLCLLLERHWMSLTDDFIPTEVRAEIISLKRFLDANYNFHTPNDLKNALVACSFVTIPLIKCYPTLVEEFKSQLNLLSRGGFREIIENVK